MAASARIESRLPRNVNGYALRRSERLSADRGHYCASAASLSRKSAQAHLRVRRIGPSRSMTKDVSLLDHAIDRSDSGHRGMSRTCQYSPLCTANLLTTLQLQFRSVICGTKADFTRILSDSVYNDRSSATARQSPLSPRIAGLAALRICAVTRFVTSTTDRTSTSGTVARRAGGLPGPWIAEA